MSRMKLWARQTPRRPWRLAPGLAELRGYQRSRLCGDVVAGITVAAVAIPSGLGMGELAGSTRWPGSTPPPSR